MSATNDWIIARQHLVVRGLGEQHVERRRDVDERVEVAAQARLLLDQRRPQSRARSSSVRRRAASRATSTSTIRRASMNSCVTPRSSAAVIADGSLDLHRRVGHEHALAVADLDDAEHREAVQRLAHGRAADAELLRQLALGRHLRARRQLADGRQQLLGDRLGELSPGRRGERDLGGSRAGICT